MANKYSVAGKIFDIYDDALLSVLAECPEFIKTASVESPDVVNKYPDSAFAMVMALTNGNTLRKYPIFTKDAALVSAYYYEHTVDDLPEPGAVDVGVRIGNALVKFGAIKELESFPLIKTALNHTSGMAADPVFFKQAEVKQTVHDTLEKIAAKAEERVLESLPDSAFAIVGKTGTGEVVRKYPISTPEQIKTAAAEFEIHHTDMPVKWRPVAAKRIYDAAKNRGLDLETSSALFKYANWDNYSIYLEQGIADRVAMKKDSRRDYVNLLEKKASLRPVEFAEELYELDREHNMVPYYDRFIEDPFAATFSAQVDDGVPPVDRDLLKVASADREKFIKAASIAFGDNFVTVFSRNPQKALAAVPTEEKEVLLDIFR